MVRIAVVRKEDCHPQQCGNYLCIRVCPINRKGDECIFQATDTKAGIDEHLCIGCDICVKKCPFDAISIINLPEQLDKPPIHRYGRNGFHLYNLPVPVFGKVVGVIGRNGIGKSTGIKILAGLQKPNLGKDTDATAQDIISFFKGTDAQRFFDMQKLGNVTISYKPQHVDMLTKAVTGKVGALLKKVNENGRLDELAAKLDLQHLFDNDLSTLSGGELQRVALAAAMLKKANVYILDEPTSYLDIKQRFKASSVIKELATPDTAVLVVEHDLIILDYLADLIYVLYGKETCYGAASLPKAGKLGINAYLAGFLREENMRFRDVAIHFSPATVHKKTKNPLLTSWTETSVKQGTFALRAAAGELLRNEVVGVVGENGIGKTTFVKMLAGLVQPSDGGVSVPVAVSYKPQYIDTSSTDLVAVVLKRATEKYAVQLIRPLQLEKLMLKQLNQLSGGELQRVAIAHCLSQDADLYLLDEPSAYLDIEQRLILSKVLREFMETYGKTALIVDHDLLFLDYLCQKLIVIDGEPGRSGHLTGVHEMKQGMNLFLKNVSTTMRRDPENNRPRINKPGSVLDREQMSSGHYYG
ncbi:ribosome biogenesis/translation initiation ATPase RLI [Candidatus Woesearchaeota archaeon]|nr:ribosome biogenesis/translation initiation ATPase RLI [Candidatus Woesearchaeota archaeon]